jgi:hypothetical protein
MAKYDDYKNAMRRLGSRKRNYSGKSAKAARRGTGLGKTKGQRSK